QNNKKSGSAKSAHRVLKELGVLKEIWGPQTRLNKRFELTENTAALETSCSRFARFLLMTDRLLGRSNRTKSPSRVIAAPTQTRNNRSGTPRHGPNASEGGTHVVTVLVTTRCSHHARCRRRRSRYRLSSLGARAGAARTPHDCGCAGPHLAGTHARAALARR